MADRFANGSTANDRGGLTGGRLATGFDPTHKGFYHGGDLQGPDPQLDYIQGLGTTAIWMTPSFKNKPVQGTRARRAPATTATGSPTSPRSTRTWAPTPSSRQLIDAAHARGIKVFFDIITNHTADVLDYPADDYVGARQPVVPTSPRPTSRTATPRATRSTTATTPQRRHASRAVDAATSFPYQPTFRSRGRRDGEDRRRGSTTRRCTTTAARRRSPARTASTATSPAVTGRRSTTSGPSGPRSSRA